MKQQLEDIQGRALAALDAATSPAALEERITWTISTTWRIFKSPSESSRNWFPRGQGGSWPTETTQTPWRP